MISNLSNPSTWLKTLLGSADVDIAVNENSMLEVPSFWYGINRISGNVATLPLNCYRRIDRGSERDTRHIGHRLLRRKPNAYQTPGTFKQSLTKHAIMWGNGRAAIYRNGRNSELIPMLPDRTITGMSEGEKYHVTMPERNERVNLIDDMQANPAACITLHDRDVLHIQGFGDGVEGLSLIEVARKSMQITLGAEKRAGKQMTKGFDGKIMIQEPENGGLFKDQKAAQEFLDDFVKRHGTDGASEAVGLLRAGLVANVLQMSNTDAQFIEGRMFQREEVALWLMLETILGNQDSASYNSEEQRQLSYLKNCLDTWLTRWEEECTDKLLTEREFDNDSHYFAFDVSSLLRTDTATQVTMLSAGISARIFSPNEAREKLEMNPYEGGDEYINPAITQAASTEPDEPEETETEPNPVIEDRMRHMIGVEEKRVNSMLEKGKDFQAIEKWYEGWADRLTKVVESLGGDPITAQNHCVRSLETLSQNPKSFDLTGTAKALAKEIENV